ncbi:MFS transporter [Lacticaseibacillus daqingensis]|uniref:MFS transporter n=1 Tax=Lacticaseibacillus daqingensis TaxID=2486014 RepID=UPI000F78D6CF|nr:MFS transporter [Lacticaseibacillus daqingensis]
MKITKQLHVAYAYAFLTNLGITQLWVLYLGQRGLSLVAIGLCESVFHLTSLLSEVPSGALADRFTYRRMLGLSRIAAVLASLMMLVNGGVGWFALSFVLSAWSYNLQSGTLEALLYESLQATHTEGQWAQVTSRLNLIGEGAASGGLLVAGTMVHWHFAATYGIAAGAAVVAWGLAGQLKEPVTHQQRTPQPLLAILQAAGGVLRHDRRLRRLMGFDAGFATLATGYYYYFQQEMAVRHFSSLGITSLLAGTAVAALAIIPLSPRLTQLPPRRVALGLTLSLIILMGLAGLGHTGGMVVAYVLIYALSALLPPVFAVYYNAAIPSAQRATLLSVSALLFSVLMVVGFPALGAAISAWGFGPTFGLMGAILGVITAVGWWLW